MEYAVQEDDDITVDKAVPFDIVFSDEATKQSGMQNKARETNLPVRPGRRHEGVRISPNKISAVGEANENASVSCVWYILE